MSALDGFMGACAAWSAHRENVKVYVRVSDAMKREVELLFTGMPRPFYGYESTTAIVSLAYLEDAHKAGRLVDVVKTLLDEGSKRFKV
jgi:hypothetical protein